MLLIKYFEINPIAKILPQVNNTTPWNPIKISVKTKLKINAGMYLGPINAGI